MGSDFNVDYWDFEDALRAVSEVSDANYDDWEPEPRDHRVVFEDLYDPFIIACTFYITLEAIREAHRAELERTLPEEPPQETGVLLKFVLPNNVRRERRFRSSDTVQTMYNYLAVNNYPTEDFVVMRVYPSMEINDLEMTLDQLNRETFHVVERRDEI